LTLIKIKNFQTDFSELKEGFNNHDKNSERAGKFELSKLITAPHSPDKKNVKFELCFLLKIFYFSALI